MGMRHRRLTDDRSDKGALLHLGSDVDEAPEPVQEASQMPLMVLPESARRRVKLGGHAAIPGSGPAGETCGSCSHAVCKVLAKRYWKCGLAKARWTGGGGTDVRLRDPACEKWSGE